MLNIHFCRKFIHPIYVLSLVQRMLLQEVGEQMSRFQNDMTHA
jgi:hypothetical protein